MPELLTMEIAKEYRDKARRLSPNGRQDIGQRRTLRMELQSRCGLTELQAVNIINGFHISDYVAIEAIKERSRKEQEKANEDRGQENRNSAASGRNMDGSI